MGSWGSSQTWIRTSVKSVLQHFGATVTHTSDTISRDAQFNSGLRNSQEHWHSAHMCGHSPAPKEPSIIWLHCEQLILEPQATSGQHVDISGTPRICLPRPSLIHLSCWDTTLAVDYFKHTHTTSQQGLRHFSHNGKLNETLSLTEGTSWLRERCRRQYFCPFSNLGGFCVL